VIVTYTRPSMGGGGQLHRHWGGRKISHKGTAKGAKLKGLCSEKGRGPYVGRMGSKGLRGSAQKPGVAKKQRTSNRNRRGVGGLGENEIHRRRKKAEVREWEGDHFYLKRNH